MSAATWNCQVGDLSWGHRRCRRTSPAQVIPTEHSAGQLQIGQSSVSSMWPRPTFLTLAVSHIAAGRRKVLFVHGNEWNRRLPAQDDEASSELDSFANSWSVWRPEIKKKLGVAATASAVFDLGDLLSDIFRSNAVTGRDNAALSQGGTAWECLVCWYLNLVL